MFLERLYIKDFRCFTSMSVDFVNGVHAVVGDNGMGKTSLLEALFFCITGTSFRTSHVKELVGFGKAALFVEARFNRLGVSHTLTVGYDGQRRRVTFNGALCPNATELLGLIWGVACTPEDIELIQGPPAKRRHYLDLFLAQTHPFYVYHLRRYNRALKQRNVLLKQKNISSLFCWEKELSVSGAYITLQRKKAVEFIHKQAQTHFERLLGTTAALDVSYDSFCRTATTLDEIQNHLEQEYKKKQTQEVEYGMTLTGPHRDDLDIRYEKKSARDFASIGQKRLMGHALRLAEWHFLNEVSNDPPLMIVDDFATSLDGAKTARLAEELSALGQVFLSSTQMPDIQSDRDILVTSL